MTMEDGQSLENMDNSSTNTFLDACRKGNIEVAKRLLETHPDMCSLKVGESAFCDACYKGNTEVAQWLLEVQPAIFSSKVGKMAFRSACKHGNIEVAKWLFNKSQHDEKTWRIYDHTDFSRYSSNVEDFTFRSAFFRGHAEVAKWLLEIHGEIYDLVFTEYWETMFINACGRGHLQIAQWFLEMVKKHETLHVQVQNVILDNDEIAFRVACRNGQLEVAKWLLEIQPDINVSARNNDPFLDACENNHLEVAKWLLEIKPHMAVCNPIQQQFIQRRQTKLLFLFYALQQNNTATYDVIYECLCYM